MVGSKPQARLCTATVLHGQGSYLFRTRETRTQLLEVLKDLPVCTGVGVRRDVVGIEEFYSILSEKTVELNGFVDLSAIAAAVGYKFRARNMTVM